MSDLLNGLNNQQLSAVKDSFTQDSLVIAGAGSGKTRVLITRVAYAVEEKGYSPSSIMAITFTNKAAREMENRLISTIGEDKTSQIWVGTFHSICIRLLRMFGEDIGFEKFTILDNNDIKKSIKTTLDSLGISSDKATANNYKKRMSSLKNDLITPLSYRKKKEEKYNNDIRQSSEYDFIRFYSKYQVDNFKNKTMDFDDIIMYTILLLKKSEGARNFVKNKFKLLLTDEVQDSNTSNITLISLLGANCNKLLVGDPDQSIYGFRNARPEFIMKISSSPKFKLFKLEQNYRSTQTIVDASNAVIKNNDDRVDKTCFSKQDIGSKISLSENANQYEEASFVADQIEFYKDNNIKLDNIMILYRTNAQSFTFEQEFLNRGINYSLIGSLGFAERKEVKDIMSFLKCSVNRKDKIASARALNCLNGVGAKTIDDIIKIMDNRNCDIVKAINIYAESKKLSKKCGEGLTLFIKFMSIATEKPVAVSQEICEFYKQSILTNKKNYEEVDVLGETREILNEKCVSILENVDELLNIAKEKEKNGESLESFVQEIDLLTSKEIDEKGVKLMTVHSAKGLESEIVFIVGASNDLFPHKNARTKQDENEERRLFYVAMTRAKKKLFITNFSYSNMRDYERSKFINEIPDNFLITL